MKTLIFLTFLISSASFAQQPPVMANYEDRFTANMSGQKECATGDSNDFGALVQIDSENILTTLMTMMMMNYGLMLRLQVYLPG